MCPQFRLPETALPVPGSLSAPVASMEEAVQAQSVLEKSICSDGTSMGPLWVPLMLWNSLLLAPQ